MGTLYRLGTGGCEKVRVVTNQHIGVCIRCFGSSTAETTLMCCEFNHNASLVAAGLSNGSIKARCNLVTIVTNIG